MTAKAPRTPPTKGLAQQRNTKMSVSINQKSVDLLPHEQDESTTGQISPPRKIMKQAASDVAHGLKDTDRGVEIGNTYAKQKLP